MNQSQQIILAALLGLLTGYYSPDGWFVAVDSVAALFMNLLKLISMPLIFLSVVSSITGMEGGKEASRMGRGVLKYTLITTVIAALVALGLFIGLDPASSFSDAIPTQAVVKSVKKGYGAFLLDAIPSNPIKPFIDGNVIGVLFLAGVVSFATLSLEDRVRSSLHSLFSALFAVVMRVTEWILVIMPFGIWAFVAQFVVEIRDGMEIASLAWYIVAIIGANLIQAFIVLPLLLLYKGLSPIKTARGMMPAFTLGFLSRSTSAALPVTMRCAEENIGVSSKTARFSLPLCATINMNACAGFILITVLYVAKIHGIVYSGGELLVWVGIATVAAMGNAAVPMGCYFVASAILASMGVPLQILGVILPVYALIDMFETAINVWSDSCVTAIVDKEANEIVLSEQSALDEVPA
jgi:Na+/H+-dicarboxylate symporter